MDNIKSYINQNLRSFLKNSLLFLLLVFGISSWQARNMLSTSGQTQAPSFVLPTLDGQSVDISKPEGNSLVLYFFAPWCVVCKATTGQIQAYHQANFAEGKPKVYAVASSYESTSRVREYVKGHGMTMPVLLADDNVLESFKVSGFPSFYILDQNGKIISKSFGFTSRWGLSIRNFLFN